MADTLTIHLSGRPVALLHEVGLNLGAALEYLPETVAEYGEGTILLSVGLPVSKETYGAAETRYFLDGLLPESAVRAQLADRARLSASDTFGLLRHYGLDCAGAVQFQTGTVLDTRDQRVAWLSDDALIKAVRDLPAAPLGVQVSDGVRSSLGGAQGKLPLVVSDGRYGVPENGYPSTHILKPARLVEGGQQEWPGIVAAEAFAMRVIAHAHRRGGRLDAAPVQPVRIGTRPALLVERFDRTHPDADQTPARIHQEDTAQALGILEKYQRTDYEPPRLADIATMLRRAATAPARELETLFELVVMNTVLGNCDAHARNISLVLREGTVALTPAYDVVPTRVWEDHSKELALRVGGEALLDDVRRSHLLDEAAQWRLRTPVGTRILDESLGRASAAIDDAATEARAEGWWDSVLDAVIEQSLARVRLYAV